MSGQKTVLVTGCSDGGIGAALAAEFARRGCRVFATARNLDKMETLTKETNTFHRTLSRHLPDPTVRSIINPVFASYREQWGAAFREAPVHTAAGKAR